VFVEYWFGDSQNHMSSPATLQSGDRLNGTWTRNILIPTNEVELHYFVQAIDDVDLSTLSETRDVVILDTEPPSFRDDSTPGVGSTGDSFSFSLKAIDNIDVKAVWVEYWYGNGTRVNLSLDHSGGFLWNGTITIEDMALDLFYRASVVDSTGNVFTDFERSVKIVDNDLPMIVDDVTPRSTTTGEAFEFDVTVTDNIGISSVTAVYAFGDVPPTSLAMVKGLLDGSGNVPFSLEIVTPLDSLANLTYHLVVEDLSGNILTGPELEVVVSDNDSPVLDYSSQVIEALKGRPLTLSIEVTDNIGVAGVFIIVRYGSGDTENLSMEPGTGYSIDMDIPRQLDGDLVFYFTARDEAGNWLSTEEHTITLVNAFPEVEDLPMWSIMEGIESTFDLESLLSDGNDDVLNLSVESDDETVTVNGLILVALYNEKMPDWTIALTVSDGEGEVEAILDVHIVNGNDIPEVISTSPENNTKFREGKIITFFVETFDEDGDYINVTWSSDGVTMGTGESIDYKKLKPGTRSVKVTVSDGKVNVDDEITLVIKKKKESPAEGGGFVIIALVVAVAMLMEYRKREDKH
jgi:hypothetical protein